MKYLYLALAIGLEVVGTSFMQASHGFSKTVPTLITMIAYTTCF